MNPKEMTVKKFAEICRDLILKGWMPCGEIGQMFFRKNGDVYDLSAANLEMLEHIEENKLFVLRFGLTY